MGIETTMHIRNDLLKKVDETAEKLDISRSRMVSILLVKYMKANRAGSRVFSKLKYQERNPKAGYSTKNIYLREDVYEMGGDVRKALSCPLPI